MATYILLCTADDVRAYITSNTGNYGDNKHPTLVASMRLASSMILEALGRKLVKGVYTDYLNVPAMDGTTSFKFWTKEIPVLVGSTVLHFAANRDFENLDPLYDHEYFIDDPDAGAFSTRFYTERPSSRSLRITYTAGYDFDLDKQFEIGDDLYNVLAVDAPLKDAAAMQAAYLVGRLASNSAGTDENEKGNAIPQTRGIIPEVGRLIAPYRLPRYRNY